MSSNQILKQYTVNEEIVKMVTRNILIVTKNMSSAIIVLGIAVIMLFVSSPKY